MVNITHGIITYRHGHHPQHPHACIIKVMDFIGLDFEPVEEDFVHAAFRMANSPYFNPDDQESGFAIMQADSNMVQYYASIINKLMEED